MNKITKCFPRRIFFAIAASSAVVNPRLAFADDTPDRPGLPASAPTLYYVSAPDCPICRGWTKNYRPNFMASAERARVHFVELVTPSVRRGPWTDEAWSPNLLNIRDKAKARSAQYGSPQFVIVKNGEVVGMQGGIGTGEYGFMPRMLELMRST